MDRLDPLTIFFVQADWNDDPVESEVNMIPGQSQEGFPSKSRGDGETNESFPPFWSDCRIKIFRIFVTTRRLGASSVEVFHLDVENFFGEFDEGSGQFDPRSGFEESQSIKVPIPSRADFLEDGIQVPTMLSDGFIGQAELVECLDKTDGDLGFKLGERRIADMLEKKFDGFHVGVDGL